MSTQSVFGRVLALLLAIAISIPATAWADPAEEAAEYYNQATTAYQSGEYQKAADLLDLAFGKNPDLVYKYNRILALQAAGDFETALNDLNAMYSPMKADGQNRFEDIDEIKAQLEAAIEARQKDEPDDTTPDETPDDTTPVEPDPTAPADKQGPNVVGLGLAGGGGAVLLTGVLFSTGLFLPGGALECYKGANGNDPLCVEYDGGDGESLTVLKGAAENTVNTHRIVAVSLIAGGAILTGVGVYFLVANKKDDTSTTGLDSIRVTPQFAREGAGMSLQMRF